MKVEEKRTWTITFSDSEIQSVVSFLINEGLLRGADFRGADLTGADFRRANLEEADLRGANIDGATFSEADLECFRY